MASRLAAKLISSPSLDKDRIVLFSSAHSLWASIFGETFYWINSTNKVGLDGQWNDYYLEYIGNDYPLCTLFIINCNRVGTHVPCIFVDEMTQRPNLFMCIRNFNKGLQIRKKSYYF